jgi:chemosensory pili system protein ChpA (sensor histidine kinase/response regulator)
MARTTSGNYDALAWVQDEIKQSLSDALKVLTRFIDDPEDSFLLEQCVTQIHQVNGIMEMLGLRGAHLLTNEMMASAVALRDGKASDTGQTQDSLLKGILLLPNYLKLLGLELEDHPIRLIDTVNELRVARGDSAIKASSVFKPNLSVVLPDDIASNSEEDLPKTGLTMGKVSHAFRLSILNWLNKDDDSSLRKLSSIIQYLRVHCTQERSIIFWWVAEGVIESLLDKGLSVNPEVKISLGNLNQPIKLFSTEGEQQLLALYPTALIDQLLLLVARSTSTGKQASALKKAFKLDFFDPQQHQQIYSFSDDAISDVRTALLEQLQEIKEQTDQFDRHSEQSPDIIQSISERFTSMAEALHLLNEIYASSVLKQQSELLQQLIEQQQLPDDKQLMILADDLLQVESILQKGTDDSIDHTIDEDQLQRTVISECLNELGNIKETLTLLEDRPDNTSETLSEASFQLGLMAGSFTMLNLGEAANLLEKTADQMMKTSAIGHAINADELGLFAEVIASTELYMEGFTQHGQQQLQLLDYAQNILSNFDRYSSHNTDEIITESQPELTPDELGTAEVVLEPGKSEVETSVTRYINQQTEPEQVAVETGVERYLNEQTESEQVVVETSVERYINEQTKPEQLVVETSVERYINEQTKPEQLVVETSVERYINEQAEPEQLVVETSVERYINELDKQGKSEAEQESNFAEGIDLEIAEIFIEEANEVLAELEILIPTWESQQGSKTLKVIRRHFHTLKGSGRMAGATIIGDLAWAVENMLNHVMEGTQPDSLKIKQLVTDNYQIIPDLLSRFIQGDMATTIQVDELIQRADNVFETEASISEHDELQQIFNSEATQHIATLKQALIQAESPFSLNKELLRAAHSLKGCANIAEVMPVAIIATQLDNIFRSIYEQDNALDAHELPLLTATIDGLAQIIEHHKDSPDTEAPDILPLIDNLDQITPAKKEEDVQQKLIDPEFLVVYLEETDDLLDQYVQQVKQLQQQPDNIDARQAIQQTLATLTSNAQHANLTTIAELYQLLEQLTQQSDSENTDFFTHLEHGYEELNNQIESLIQNKPASDIDGFKQQVEDYLNRATIQEPEQTEDSSETASAEQFTLPTSDAELLEAFTEECTELLESSGNALKNWQQDHNDQEATMQLQRDLHTIKGGARLVGVTPLADLTHQTESLVLSATEHGQKLNPNFFNLLQRCQDRLADMQDQLANKTDITFANDLLTEISQFSGQTESAPLQTNMAAIDTQGIEAEPVEAIPETVISETKATHQTSPVEQVRVRADLLDFLTNFAGEVNISRDRVSQQNAAIRRQLTEMDDTVSRLQDQLRNLEIETETQILFRYEDETHRQQSEFDPLELDRFSMMQQLSRGLTESVSDLNDIGQSLDILVRDTDAILLQQSRLNTDIQQGLMNTRLLPFSGLVPRFERIVRQTNTELGKKAELSVHGANRELDRTILDRIVAPIEHLLRNAISHGIETPEKRSELAKDETGKLTLTIARDGSEVLITLADDGQGINIENIRKKALKQNLVNPDNMPSDEELIQLILTSGFSTADNVSQLSGRGVGMDIVSSEIRALKGRLSIQSVTGQGTTFSIRLPLTLSIMQALLVGSHDQQYAIPLATVHAGERIAVEDIKTLLAQDSQPRYEFNGAYYPFIPLAKLLNQPLNLPDDPKVQLPLLLFRSGDIHIALLVDSINSNREIVLKSVGAQLGNIAAINGATILGDGQVVFILDIPTLVDTTNLSESSEIPEISSSALELDEIQDRTPVAMVVDDSITMRKASGNLLKRHGFDVITARDGIDAVAQLNEQIPDIILLDVEMPRMDGFEFATLVRNNDQYNELPIIMITSRTGDKHRDRAMNIGVNAYLGKPYQETDLVETMQDLLGDNYPSARH